MQSAAHNILLPTILSSFRADPSLLTSGEAFYQHILAHRLVRQIGGAFFLQQLGASLVELIEEAFALRRVDLMEQMNNVLLHAPVSPAYKGIAQYFQAIYTGRKGDIVQAQKLLESIPPETPLEYRSRAMGGAGTINWLQNNYANASAFYFEAVEIAAAERQFNPRTLWGAQSGTVLLKSMQGDHHGALADLERMIPLARAAGRMTPALWYSHLNSLAVELMEVGRLEEARNVADRVVASPFAAAYPEWLETRADIAVRQRGRSRSLVAFTRREPTAGQPETSTPGKVLRLPERGRDTAATADPASRPAAVLDFQEWMIKMMKKPKGEPPAGSADNPTRRAPASDWEYSTGRQLMLRIIELAAVKELTDDDLREMVRAMEAIVARRLSGS